ncbi:MAG: hypothetical protein LBV32_07620 [Tannerellaceae bacterium]|jgi:hypothetical protein|nr:hypothetical protein [Tannerellaceae bacterium]
MKKTLLLSIFCLIVSVLSAQTEKAAWDYPVKPGMEEWKKFQTGQEMLDACQIPAKILSKLTTEALVEICINYPMAFDYLAYNNEREAISFMIEHFNGLKELSRRTDGASDLLKAYKNFSFSNSAVAGTQNNRSSSLMFGYLELLLVDDLFISKLSTSELSDLKNISLEKYSLKLNNPEHFGLLSIKRSFLINSIVIMKNNISLDKSENSSIQEFVSNYQSIPAEKLERISKLIVEK